jgi:hypothetical protein
MSVIHTHAAPPTPVIVPESSIPDLNSDTVNLTASLNETERKGGMGGGGCLLIPGCGGAVGSGASIASSIVIAGLVCSMIWGGF